jgi:hypothetical protein
VLIFRPRFDLAPREKKEAEIIIIIEFLKKLFSFQNVLYVENDFSVIMF